MKQIIVYQSKTGITQRYAELLAEQTGIPLLPLRQATPAALAEYDRVIFGSRLCAGHVDGLKKFLSLAQGKALVLFATGAAPDQEDFWKDNLTEEQLANIPRFYFPGGLCYEKMGLSDKLMMKAAAFFLSRRPGADPRLAETIRRSYDIFEPSAVAPLVELLKKSQ